MLAIVVVVFGSMGAVVLLSWWCFRDVTQKVRSLANIHDRLQACLSRRGIPIETVERITEDCYTKTISKIEMCEGNGLEIRSEGGAACGYHIELLFPNAQYFTLSPLERAVRDEVLKRVEFPLALSLYELQRRNLEEFAGQIGDAIVRYDLVYHSLLAQGSYAQQAS